jgi:hypothetical protein
MKSFLQSQKSWTKNNLKGRFNKLPRFSFTSANLEVPTINFDKFMKKSQGWEQECKLAAECLHDTGILVIKDSVIIFILIPRE